MSDTNSDSDWSPPAPEERDFDAESQETVHREVLQLQEGSYALLNRYDPTAVEKRVRVTETESDDEYIEWILDNRCSVFVLRASPTVSTDSPPKMAEIDSELHADGDLSDCEWEEVEWAETIITPEQAVSSITMADIVDTNDDGTYL